MPLYPRKRTLRAHLSADHSRCYRRTGRALQLQCALARSSRMSTTRQRCAYIAAGMAWLDVSHLRIEWRQRPAHSVSSTTPRAHARSVPPVLGNRHVEIACAASAHVNVSVLYQFIDTASSPRPTSVAPRRGFSRSSSAWPGRSQKDGLPSYRGGTYFIAVQGNQLAHTGGAAWLLPLSIGDGNGHQDTRPCFAHLPVALLRGRRLDFGLPDFGFGLFCARFSRRGPDVDQLILKRAAFSRSSGQWDYDDYDVLCDGIVVGRIMKIATAPVDTPWLWTLAFGHHEDRTPTIGYAATREAARAAFAKSWRRE